LWGGGGGGGGGSAATIGCGFCDYGCPGGSEIRGANGGTAGRGGYNKAIISVTPGTSYSITIGSGGVGGTGGNFTTINGSDGTDGGNSSFGSLLSAPGGTKGFGAISKNNPPSCSNGNGGSNGSVNNFSTNSQYTIQGVSTARSYLPVGYVQQLINSNCCSPGGGGGTGGRATAYNRGSSSNWGTNGGGGEAGYCVIIY
jgi:hypothetical protein